MTTTALDPADTPTERHWDRTTRNLGTAFATRAAVSDRRGEFVDENYRELREHGLFWMGIPAELSGGGARYAEVVATIRELGRHCGSTALAFSMHSHPIALNVFKHLRGDEGATRTLRRIAEGRLVVAGTGANDWLESSGQAVRENGGFRVTAHKRFVSGAPGAQVFVTSVRYDGGQGPEVLHFSVPFSAEGIRIVETWDALGMRGTGSHDVELRDVFVRDEAVVARRPAGVWHPMWDAILPVAMPLITAAYVGMADRAAALGLEAARTKGPLVASAVGEMLNALTVADLALADMVRLTAEYGFTPDIATTSAVLTRKAIATDAVRQTAELAGEIVGGSGFIKGHPIERIVRDVRAMHFHPLPARRQREFAGRVALGLDPSA
jgi:alkylation response protein AidB-like acyl-CoA dehydrogenase